MKIKKATAIAAIIPLILVNGVAIAGQLAFLRAHLSWGLPGDVAFAAALESVAIYLAYHAHIALVNNDSAFRLRMASYLFAAGIGAMNYSHYAGPRWRPTFEAAAVGLMSASSPWLWAIHSRRQNRSELLSKGLIEPRSLRLGSTRWLWHPLRSARVMYAATWAGVQHPDEAIALIEPRTITARVAIEHRPETLADMTSQADAVRFALAELARTWNRDIGAIESREVVSWLQDHAADAPDLTVPSGSYVADVIRRTLQARNRAAGGKITQLRGRHAS